MAIEHYISATHAWHGRLMVLAWTILLPLGILIARYFKVTRRQAWPQQLDNKLWWHSHVTLQIAGVACMSLGLAIVLLAGGVVPGQSLHAMLGWLVVTLGWLQLIGGYLRGSKGGPVNTGEASRIEHGDHYDMTRRRVWFEWLHKIGGYGAVLLSMLVTALGLWRVDAPRWMWLTIILWWAMLLIAAFRLQRAGRCIDTYQAIWGPDPQHPGNARKVIGWGIQRYTADSYKKSFGDKKN